VHCNVECMENCSVSRYTKAVERSAMDGGDGYASYAPPTAVFRPASSAYDNSRERLSLSKVIATDIRANRVRRRLQADEVDENFQKLGL
jgi:hypothetical protein